MSKENTEKNTSVAEAVSRTELFFSSNRKIILAAVAVVIIAAAGIFLYHKYGYMPARQEALGQTFQAEANFRNGEYELALNGDGNVLGFAQVIDQYGSKAGKSMQLYAGICELQLGNFDSALSYLKQYKGKEPVLAARAKACEGDAYVGLGDYKSAVACYDAAIGMADNVFVATYLLKQGLAYEALGDKAAALKCYRTIEDQYPQAVESYDIYKYISRVSE